MTRKFVAAIAAVVVAMGWNPADARAADAQDGVSGSHPQLLRRIPFGDFGSKYARIGDLNGDGLPEIVLVQVRADGGEHKAVITCVTAIDLEGKVLWQVGRPNPENIYFGGDFPIQIHDLDRDGQNEVIYIPDEKNVLTILEGRSGRTLKEVQLAGGHDSLLFADFTGSGYAHDMLVKDRYTSIWIYDKDFRPLWSKPDCNPGHYPMEYDLDGDGRDELLCGYTLYGPDGKALWSLPLSGHNDAVYIDDMDGDGKAEIAIAASDGKPGPQALLVGADGKILFRKECDHAQHALIGDFRPDLVGKEVCFIDRQVYRGGPQPHHSELTLYTKSGEKLLSIRENIWYLAGEVIDNWLGQPGVNSIGLYSRGFAPPGLLDGEGREIATFPLPEAIKQPGGGPDGKDLYDDYYMQHLDYCGDDREEIFCYNHTALLIWTNAAPLESARVPVRPKSALAQPPRLYNNNFYPGRL